MQTIRSLHAVGGLTDAHDSVLLPNGGALLMSYPNNTVTGKQDALIEEVDSNNQVVFAWNSADHIDPATESVTEGDRDYAHLNSLQILPNGDILASFRHPSAVLRIARTAHDGFQAGDIIWRFGGRKSDFTFAPGEGGPCAQHTATLHPDGHMVIFDNSPNAFWGNLCVDQDDPSGPTKARGLTRITEYDVDEDAMSATLLSDYSRPGYASGFAGSAYRLDNGQTLIGWGGEPRSIAQENDAAGNILWDLVDPNPVPADRYRSYRAHASTWVDSTPPTISSSLSDGQVFAQGATATLEVTCTDRGGSALTQCGLGNNSRVSLDTSALGEQTVQVTARDLAGNETIRSLSWKVIPGGSPGIGVFTARSPQDWLAPDNELHLVKGRMTRATVRVTNTSAGADVIRLRSPGKRGAIRIIWRHKGRNLTRQLTTGTWASRKLQPGESQTLTLLLTPKRRASTGLITPVRLLADSQYTSLRADRSLRVFVTSAKSRSRNGR